MVPPWRRFFMLLGLFSVALTILAAPTSRAYQLLPTAGTPAPIVIASEVFARAIPAAVENPELAIGRVTIMPGAVIPRHYHPGTQVAVIVQGTLTYSVFTGEVLWVRAGAETDTPSVIAPGETVELTEGDALIESPDSIHQGRNVGTVPVVIYLSTLFPADAPRSIVVEASPTP